MTATLMNRHDRRRTQAIRKKLFGGSMLAQRSPFRQSGLCEGCDKPATVKTLTGLNLCEEHFCEFYFGDEADSK